MTRERPLALTVGDPRGIGPEVCGAAVRALVAEGRSPSAFVVAGPANVLSAADLPAGVLREALPAWDGTEEGAGRAVLSSLEWAVARALEGSIHGLVTGPVHKPALRAAGAGEPGQTELLGRLSGARTVGMLMCAERTRGGGPLRVLLATTHLPLREVAARITPGLLEGQTRLVDEALRLRWEIAAPRIAVCALNPHASDGGLFGDEEDRVYGPALSALRRAGVDAHGPVPADTVFVRALAGEFDAVVAPYHDVGMAPFKAASFGTGVNVTLGLPFIRTSPDHGTAFDIAGTGRADPSSTVEAARLALRLARAGFDTPVRPA